MYKIKNTGYDFEGKTKKDMEAMQTSSCGSESDSKQVLISKECEPTKFINECHPVRILENLQCLRKNEILCDIKFETDDGAIVSAHKNVIMAASPYFWAMFNYFDESNKNLVKIRNFDSTILKLLLDFIYSGKIKVSEENVQILLPAANILQLDFVNDACVDFFQKHMDPTNCLGIKTFAEFHNCMELLLISEKYIRKHYLRVFRTEDFLSLSSEDLSKIICCNDLIAFEERIFESIIKWTRHDLEQRKDYLPKLVEHVRMPLIETMPDIFNILIEEPLLKNSPECDQYVLKSLRFNPHYPNEHFTIPETIRCKPKQLDVSKKVILIFIRSKISPKCCTEWYDPVTRLRKNAPNINDSRRTAGMGVITDRFVFVVGGVNKSSSKSVSMLDVSAQSPSWVPMVDMLISRNELGVGVLDNCIYAVGGNDGTSALNSVEVFDNSTQKWRMVSSMSITRRSLGVGVLDNRLYAVGGYNGESCLKSVECYDPSLDNWTPVAEMSEPRGAVGVGVLDGVIYAIGGYNGSEFLKSAEIYRPSDGVWSTIATMHFRRNRPGVLALHGLLYVFGGEVEKDIVDIVQIYNPDTNTWSLEILSRSSAGKIFSAVAVDKTQNELAN